MKEENADGILKCQKTPPPVINICSSESSDDEVEEISLGMEKFEIKLKIEKVDGG